MSASRLHVLGTSGAWPGAGRACSGYVLEHAGSRVVLDLGYGTVVRLLAHLGSDAGARRLLLTHFWPGVDRAHRARGRGGLRRRGAGGPGGMVVEL